MSIYTNYMRKAIPVITVLTLLLCSACGDIHPTDNRKIDGYWLLTNVDTLSNSRGKDVTQEKLFWAIEGKLFQAGGLTLMTEKYGDTLHLYRPAPDSTAINSKYSSIDPFRKYGINSFDEHFIIEQLNGKHLIVRDSLLKLQFRRY
nr:lipocalin-like domain-containing protein [uncultured Prevotella sp.]